MTKEEINSIPIVFQLGIWRSGTTLLKFMLDAHPNIIAPTESIFVVYLKKKYSTKRNWDKATILRFVEDLYSESKFNYVWNVDKTKLTNHLLEFENELNFQTACKIVYLNYPSPFKKAKINVIVAKNPIYFLWMDELKEIFPEAKFMTISRGYKSNYLSRKKYGLDIFSTTSALAWRWELYYQSILKFNQKHPAVTCLVRYEDLIKNPEKELTSICSFLNLAFNPNMLDYQKDLHPFFKKAQKRLLSSSKENQRKAKEHIANFEMQKKLIRPTQEVIEEHKEKLGSRITQKELGILQQICSTSAGQLGYEAINNASQKASFSKILVNMTNSGYRFLYNSLPFSLRRKVIRFLQLITGR